MTRFAKLFFVAAAMLAWPGAAQSQDAASYPGGQVKIIVPFGPGGSTDVLSRLIADKLGAAWGATVIVENMPGAGGSIGATALSQAAPDGRTLLTSSNSPIVFNPLTQDVAYDPAALEPVIQLTTSPLIIAVNPALGLTDFASLVAHAKANEGQLNYAIPGVGGGNHLAMIAIQRATGIKLEEVVYPGGAPAAQAVAAGEVDLTILSAAEVMPLLEGNRAIPVAVGSAERMPELPDVPTLQEVGLPEDVLATAWLALFAPPGTPQDIIEKINAAVAEALRAPEVQEKLGPLSLTVVGGSVADTATFVTEERERWSRIFKESGISIK